MAPVSSGGGYAAPSSGYGASSGGGYAAPSGGYGAPSGGYGAPCDSYGKQSLVVRKFSFILLCQAAVPGPLSMSISKSRNRWMQVALSPLSSLLVPSPSSCLSDSSHLELFSPPPPSSRQLDGQNDKL